jgi:hypothetical protein
MPFWLLLVATSRLTQETGFSDSQGDHSRYRLLPPPLAHQHIGARDGVYVRDGSDEWQRAAHASLSAPLRPGACSGSGSEGVRGGGGVGRGGRGAEGERPDGRQSMCIFTQ